MKRNAFFIVTLGQFPFLARVVNGAVVVSLNDEKKKRQVVSFFAK